MEIILLSGLSGAGKSLALSAFEDLGIYSVDNLPASMLSMLVGELELAGKTICACAIDARSAFCAARLLPEIERLSGRHNIRKLFLEARKEELLRRFSETRRRHPLETTAVSLDEAVDIEIACMSDIRDNFHRIDSTGFKPAQLRREIVEYHDSFKTTDSASMVFRIESFGFKIGHPPVADFVFDARCLPNPHWVPALRELTGKDQPVKDFFAESPEAAEYVKDVSSLLARLAKQFTVDGRSQVTCAIGCTGGQHRSVWVAEAVSKSLREAGLSTSLRHRVVG